MIRVFAILAFLVGGMVRMAVLEARPNSAELVQLPEVEMWELANGLQVAFLPIETASSVAVQVWYRAGSKDEVANRGGSASMLKYMMFGGTTQVRPRQHAQSVGEVGGRIHALVDEDMSAYHNTVPAAYMDFVIQLEASRMRGLWFRDEMVVDARKQLEESLKKEEATTVFRAFSRLLNVAYQVHPYSRAVGGNRNDLEKISLADVKNYYDNYYVPNNAMVVVVGKTSGKEVRESVERWFGKIVKGTDRQRMSVGKAEPVQRQARRNVANGGSTGLVMLAYHIPEAKHADTSAVKVLAQILFGGESARLSERLVRNGKLAEQVSGELLVREHPGLLLVIAAYANTVTPNRVEMGIQKQIRRMQNFPVSSNELRRAKTQLTASFVFGLESISDIASAIGRSWGYHGAPSGFLGELEGIGKVSAADVKRVARQYLQPSQANIVVVRPPNVSDEAPGGQKN